MIKNISEEFALIDQKQQSPVKISSLQYRQGNHADIII